jgi:hypothetical protein
METIARALGLLGSTASLLALAACGGSDLVDDNDGGASGEGGAVLAQLEDAGLYDPGAGASAFSAGAVQAALATCTEPHGPPVAITDGNDESALAAGAWVLCPGGPSTPSVFSPGMILAPGGAWTQLMSDGDGGLVAVHGLQTQGTWAAFCEASTGIPNDQSCVFNDEADVNIVIQADSQDVSTDACYGGPVTFESSPRRMYVVDFPALYCDGNSTIPTFDLWLVPLGQ